MTATELTRRALVLASSVPSMGPDLGWSVAGRWSPAVNSSDGAWIPQLDVVETEDHYEIASEIPGCDPASVDITWHRDTLTLRAARSRRAAESTARRLLVSERPVGTFTRTIRLATPVDADRIEASYAYGVLTIIVPKSPSARPRRIQIRRISRLDRLAPGLTARARQLLGRVRAALGSVRARLRPRVWRARA